MDQANVRFGSLRSREDVEGLGATACVSDGPATPTLKLNSLAVLLSCV